MMEKTLEELYRPILPHLENAKATVRSIWTGVLRLVHGPDLKAPEMSGKLLRPAMCLLSAGALGAPDLGRFVGLAAAFEVLHLAALVHDDVIDRADLRRGVTSLNALWNDHAAVLGGDYLVARSTALITPYNSCPLIENVVESVRQMSEGELRTLGRAPESLTEADCIKLAEQKTASLFASTCVGPTYLLGDTHREALHRYGMGFGIAFQLADDLLDLSQSEQQLGKPSCGDIVEGKVTLPILFMREAFDGDEKQRLKSMQGASITDDDRMWIAEAQERTGARRRTETVALTYLADARRALETLPPSLFRDNLLHLLEFVLVRGS